MLVCPLYERERKEIEGKEIVIVGFRPIASDNFQGVIDVIKEFGAKYVPEKRIWYVKPKEWEGMLAWFETQEEAKQYYVEADEEYEAIRRAL